MNQGGLSQTLGSDEGLDFAPHVGNHFGRNLGTLWVQRSHGVPHLLGTNFVVILQHIKDQIGQLLLLQGPIVVTKAVHLVIQEHMRWNTPIGVLVVGSENPDRTNRHAMPLMHFG